MAARPGTDHPPRILVIGGGHLGLYAAQRLQQRLPPGEAELILAEPLTHMTYQPLLPEVAAGTVEPRHVTVPVRPALPRFHVVTAEVVELRHADRTARVRLIDGSERDLAYDHVVVGPGTVSRTAPVPGLAELAVGFETLGEAVFLRNRVIIQLALAASTSDPAVRRRALTFVVFGAGYAGVEAVGELSDRSMDAIKTFAELRHEKVRWILVEPTDRILPEVSPALGEYTANVLRARGVEIWLETSIASCVGGRVRFHGRHAGDVVEANTKVWTAGIRPHPMLDHTDLPRDPEGRVLADAYLRVRGTPGAWTGGDCAAVPDLTCDEPGALCAPTAQHAIRQGRRLADNLVADVRGPQRNGPPKPYRHRYAGSVMGMGRMQGVAEVYGVRLSGTPAWLLHRVYHWLMLPSGAGKARVLTDWIFDALFSRDISALAELQEPHKPLQTAARAPAPSTQTA
ncbi:FAD-dependent oxidoreductase [Planosporangium flavigriseum]|uniref:NAD(P)/FAD-dependent oxidoreductase n=1 Tax=Planosporangium flavigriseum TaxID=373681 RepID=UPI001439BBFA|nr:FAD-dependent oxidoreductase [Planosporangium flavigriseum]NJC65674.1 FAD-dependent oxidoreductase [Planosporangium flavigriseum]